MPKPFANSAQITYSLVNGDWLLGIQTGNSTGDAGLPQMKHIKLSQLSDWVRGTYGQIWRYRGPFSASLPSDAQANDYFLATATFTVDGVTYTKDHLYAYNASGTWDDISDVLSQYASQAQVTDIDDRLTVAEEKIDAMGDGIVYKGEVATYADLAGIVDPQTGWEYYVTADAAFYIYNGASWDQIDNGIVQTITDGDTAHAPSGDAVYDALASEASAREAEDSNLKSAISKDEARITNLEEKADPTGAYKTVNYRGTNAVPPNKAKYALVESIVGKSRAWNQLVDKDNFSWLPYAIGTWSIPSGPLEPNSTVKNLVIPVIGGHKYLASRTIITSRFRFGSTVDTPAEGVTLTVIEPNADSEYSVLLTVPSGANYLVAYIALASDANYLDSANTFLLRDLTPIFPDLPSTDLETSNIPALVKRCPDLLKYDAYGTSIVDTTVEGVESKGFNLWDEQTQGGYYNASGVFISRTDQLCTLNKIGIKPNTAYYFKSPNPTQGNFCFYDANENFLLRIDSTASFPSPPNAYYLNVSFGAQYGATYNHDICINISGSEDGTYKSYVAPVTLTLPTSVTLRSAGSVHEELDVESGVKTNPLSDELNMSEIGLSGYDSSTKTYAISSNLWKKPASNNDVADVLCSHYQTVSRSNLLNYDKCVCINEYGVFIVRDTSFTGSDVIQGKVQYALATPNAPTQLTPVIDNTILTEGGGTINTIQNNVYPDDSPAPTIDNSMDVGYLAL